MLGGADGTEGLVAGACGEGSGLPALWLLLAPWQLLAAAPSQALHLDGKVKSTGRLAVLPARFVAVAVSVHRAPAWLPPGLERRYTHCIAGRGWNPS